MTDETTVVRELISKLDLPLDKATARIKRLPSLTNRVYRITSGKTALCLRLPGRGTEKYIDREAEAVAVRAAAAAGVSPDIVHVDPATGALVTRFVADAATMTAGQFGSQGGAVERASRALKRLHACGAVFVSPFDMFGKLDRYIALLRAKKLDFPGGLTATLREVDTARAALERNPAKLVACHCDPVPANFLDSGRRMWLVDWEYAGMNDPMWDLSYLSVEADFDQTQEETLVLSYFAGMSPGLDRERIAVYKPVCHLLAGVWGLVQHVNNNPGVDFWAFSLDRLRRCEEVMQTPAYAESVWRLGRVR